MSQALWSAVDQYLTDALVRDEPALAAALAASAAAKLPAIHVSPPQGMLLRLLAQLVSARRILEVGTLGAYSTLWLAGALPDDGTLVTLEVDPHHAEVARRNIAAAPLAHRVDLRLGKAIDTLNTLIAEAIDPFDLIFIDADKSSTADYVQAALKLSRPGTLIIVDNVVREGRVVDADSADASVLGVRRFIEQIAGDPRVQATAIQTVGSKGYDGLALLRVTSAV